MQDSKACSVCKQVLSLDNFSNKNNTKTGKASACKPCTSKQKAASYLRNIEHNKKYRKDYYQKNSKLVKARAAKWAKDNPKRQYARSRKWLLSKPGLANNYSHRRRAKVRNLESFVISQKFLTRLYQSPCVYCGSTQMITQDHVIPVDKGGRHSEGNLVPACQSCNSSKANLLLMEWKRKRATQKSDPQSW